MNANFTFERNFVTNTYDRNNNQYHDVAFHVVWTDDSRS
ncbi:MAG: hypothetical protein UX89_C0008G0009 [Parcubacteria group bacterium GW2011_GWA2_47_16]|nr:MAG: hypothetical protein UX89_C0008G0009 [Parcubacteria group bacterium GW2011_GWA2_47_16]